MLDIALSWFQSFPPQWVIFCLSMLPIIELQAAIPLGIHVYHLPIVTTFVYSVMGNMVPIVPLLLLLPYMHDWLVKQPFIGTVLKNRLLAAERLFSGKHAKYGAIGLVLFIALPGPFTGAWTGSLAAFIFRIPFKKAFPLIFIGVCLAALVVLAITLFAGETLGWLL